MFLVEDPTWPHVPSPAHELLGRLEAALEPPLPPAPPVLAVWDRPTPPRAPRSVVGEHGDLTTGLRLPGWKTPL